MRRRNASFDNKRVFPQIPVVDYSRAIVCATNEEADAVNSSVIDTITGGDGCVTYRSIDSAEETVQQYPMEFLNSLNPSGLPPHQITLTKSAPIILIRNLNPKQGLLNGTRLSVVNLGRRVIEAKIETGNCKNTVVFIPRITLAPSDTTLPFVLRRRQFPIRLAYAMTINKSQGQTFSFIGIDLRTPVFSHGQLYVALSRVGSFRNMAILTEKDEEEYRATNVVFSV